MNIKIRKMDTNLVINNFERIIELRNLIDSNHSLNNNDINRKKISELVDYISEDKAIVFGAFDDNLLIGFIWGYPRIFFLEKRIFINALIVDAQYKGNGIGKLLVNKLMEYCKNEKGYYSFDVMTNPNNINALGFYKHLGFIEEKIQLKMNLKNE